MRIVPLSSVEYLRQYCGDNSRFPDPYTATEEQMQSVPYVAEVWATSSGIVHYDFMTERVIVSFDEIRTMFDNWKKTEEFKEDYPSDCTVYEWLRDCIDSGFHPCELKGE